MHKVEVGIRRNLVTQQIDACAVFDLLFGILDLGAEIKKCVVYSVRAFPAETGRRWPLDFSIRKKEKKLLAKILV